HEFEDLDHFFNIVNKFVESHQHSKPNIKFDFIQDKHFDNVDIELDKRRNYPAQQRQLHVHRLLHRANERQSLVEAGQGR
ncbi:MAG: hypothetical protein L6R36_008983, partial [Xanthoria steineri]